MAHKTLVLHPRDKSTEFLQLAYCGIDATVLTGDVRRPQVRKLMDQFDQILMLGHGSPHGLFAVGQFPDCQYIVDATLADQLRERDNSIFIWCYAAEFVRKHCLRGFATGMFISEPAEANWFDLTVTDAEIRHSNNLFAEVIGRFANQRPKILHAAVVHEYGRLTTLNPVAKFNAPRVRLFDGEAPVEQLLPPREQRVPDYGSTGVRIPQQYVESVS